MKYIIDMSERASDNLFRIPVEFQCLVIEYMDTLAESPSKMSRSVVSPPYSPGGMMSEFQIPLFHSIHHFVVFFRYGTDEARLVIT